MMNSQEQPMNPGFNPPAAAAAAAQPQPFNYLKNIDGEEEKKEDGMG